MGILPYGLISPPAENSFCSVLSASPEGDVPLWGKDGGS